MRFARTLSVFAFAGMLSLPLLSGCAHDDDHRHSRGDWDDRRAYPAGWHDRDDLRRDRDDWRHDRDHDYWRHDRD